MTDSHAALKAAEPEAASVQVERSIDKRFIELLFLFSAIFFGVSLPVYFEYKEGIQEQLLASEEVALASTVQMIQKEMYEQLHMLDMLARTHLVNDYLAQSTEKNRLRVEKMFETFSTSFHRYD